MYLNKYIDKRNNTLDNMRTPLMSRKKSEKIFYVCSYGGCGSKMLCAYLSNFGTVKHIHSRVPPSTLTHIDNNELFTNNQIGENELHNYYVIYIYRDPAKAILSRFTNPAHLSHIQINPSITLQQVLDSKQDLYGIETFYNNYTNNISIRNYKIYCVKYEEFFQKITEFNKMFNLYCDNMYHPVEKTTNKLLHKEELELKQIYVQLIERMNKMPFIKIV